MIVITNEYNYIIIKLNETRNIVENTLKHCRRKYKANCSAKKVKCVVEFLVKKTKQRI